MNEMMKIEYDVGSTRIIFDLVSKMRSLHFVHCLRSHTVSNHVTIRCQLELLRLQADIAYLTLNDGSSTSMSKPITYVYIAVVIDITYV